MKLLPIKCIFFSMAIIFCLTSCNHNNGNLVSETDIPITNELTQIDGETYITSVYQTTVPDISVIENTEMSEEQSNIKDVSPRHKLYGALDLVEDKLQMVYIDLPNDNVDIENLKTCIMLSITLSAATDLSFLADFTELKGLSITNGKEDPIPEPWNESYVKSYDFLKSLNNLEFLRIGKEPQFNTNYLQNMSNLKYLNFYGTNVIFDGYFPHVEELTIGGGELSSNNLYDFFPNLTGLSTSAINISLKSVGKMQKLEILDLSYCQSYSEINEIANNKRLRSLSLTSRIGGYTELVEDESFILELPNLEYFWCLEGVISDETINKILEVNPQCDVFNHGM